MTTFAERLNIIYREFRMDASGNGRIAFAKKLQVTKGQLDGWLDGVGAPDFEKLKELSAKLNISVLWLLGISNERALRLDEILDENIKIEQSVEMLLDFLRYRYGDRVDHVLRNKFNQN